MLIEHLPEEQRTSYVNAQDAQGATALHKACFEGHVEVVKLLCKHNADPSIRDNEGSFGMHKAAFSGHLDCVKHLLETFRSAPSTPARSRREKHLANKRALKALKADAANGVDAPVTDCSVSAATDSGLHTQPNTVDINCQDDSGSTPLHKACYKGNVECVKLLLDSGANLLVKDNQGSSAPFPWPKCSTWILIRRSS